MEWIVLGAVVILVAVIIYFVYAQKSKWKTLQESRGMTDEIANAYSHLLDQGIRCRLKETSSSDPAAQPGMAMQAGGGGKQKVRLEVHKDDFEKAKTILQQFSSRDTYSPTTSI